MNPKITKADTQTAEQLWREMLFVSEEPPRGVAPQALDQLAQALARARQEGRDEATREVQRGLRIYAVCYELGREGPAEETPAVREAIFRAYHGTLQGDRLAIPVLDWIERGSESAASGFDRAQLEALCKIATGDAPATKPARPRFQRQKLGL